MPTTTTLAMIVRDEAANLPACLESVRGLFDETVVVDTGSADGTVKVARSFGARVFRFAWRDDFAAARNYGLSQVTTDYWFRMDADDRLYTGHRKRLSRLLSSLDPRRPEAWGFDVHSREHTGTNVSCMEMRLFPAHEGLKFTGRVHERILLGPREAHITMRDSQVRLDHSGYQDADTYYCKLRRNLRILEMEADTPNASPMLQFDLGRTQSALRNYERAIAHLRRYISEKDPHHNIAGRLAYRTLVETYRLTGEIQAATLTAQRGLTEYPGDATLCAHLADLLREAGHYELAVEGYERALALCGPAQPDVGVSVTVRAELEEALKATRIQAATTPPQENTAPPSIDLHAMLAI